MVGTRRSSPRLQVKTDAISSDEKHAQPSPAKSTPTRRSRNTTPVKKSPASASKAKSPTPTKRGRSPKAVKPIEKAEEERQVVEVQDEDEDEVVVVDDDSVEEIPVPEQDAAETEEDEEVVMMLPDSDDDEETEEEVENKRTEEAQEPEEPTSAVVSEDDILSYALMAASGLNLSTKTPAASDSSTTARRSKLVPDALDSGASKDAYFQFNGQRCSNGAQLVAAKRASEESQVVAKQHQVSALSEQQRTEAKSVKSAGRKWFNMASEDMTPEARRDFALLRMRNYLDPKKFYKTSDHHKNLPKHFQLGTVIEGAHEFKSARLVKKDRRQTFTEEIMADQQVQSYTKRVFTQINNARSGTARKKLKARK